MFSSEDWLEIRIKQHDGVHEGPEGIDDDIFKPAIPVTEVYADTPNTNVEDTDHCFLREVVMGFGSIQLSIPLILRLPLLCMLLPIVIHTNTEARHTWKVPWNPIEKGG